VVAARILLAVNEPEVAVQIAALITEDPEFELTRQALDVGGVSAALGREDIDVVLLHHKLAPLPVMELARDLTTRFPNVAFVLLVEEATRELLRSAIQAGARDVLAPPFTVDELRTSVRSAAEWARAVRSRLTGQISSKAEGVGGATIAVAGAKGGVGATTVAIHLALAAAAAGRTTCLVDFDLQAGDVRGFFDLPPRRSVSDLVEVAPALTGTQLAEAVYEHESGLRILLSPEEGESAEEIGAAEARGLIGALKFAYEVVIIDIGSVVNDATAVAVELVDAVLVVTTPDVPALRAATRLVELWKRLQVRDERSTYSVLNRASRNREIQPDLARRILSAPLLESTIPADFRSLETAINTGVPGRLPEGPLRSALDALAAEVRLVEPPPKAAQRRVLARSEAGQVTVELMGLTGVLLGVILMLWQIALVGYTFVLADHAAREGARALAVDEPAREAAMADVPGAWTDETKVTLHDERVEVAIEVPLIVPGMPGPFALRASEGTVDEGG
jgi:pilus assembly protein CpaE